MAHGYSRPIAVYNLLIGLSMIHGRSELHVTTALVYRSSAIRGVFPQSRLTVCTSSMSAPAALVAAPREAPIVSLSRPLYTNSSKSASDSNDGRRSRDAPNGARNLGMTAAVGRAVTAEERLTICQETRRSWYASEVGSMSEKGPEATSRRLRMKRETRMEVALFTAVSAL